MKIQKGIVKYKDRNDIVCTYGLTDDGKQYYFLDESESKKLPNGSRIATTALIEAVDPMVKPNNVGLIDASGNIIIPFENRSIRQVNDDVLVVEKAVPTTQSVLDSLTLRNDPQSATKLVSTPAHIKDKLSAQMGCEGKYLFNDQFSEASIFNVNGVNLVNNEYYSFISTANDKLYMSKNTTDSVIDEYDLTQAVVDNTPIDVSQAVVDQQVVENALNSSVVPTDTNVVADNAFSATIGDVSNDAVSSAIPTDPLASGDMDASLSGSSAGVAMPTDASVSGEVVSNDSNMNTSLPDEVSAVSPADANTPVDTPVSDEVVPYDPSASLEGNDVPLEPTVPTENILWDLGVVASDLSDSAIAIPEVVPDGENVQDALMPQETPSYDDALSSVVFQGDNISDNVMPDVVDDSVTSLNEISSSTSDANSEFSSGSLLNSEFSASDNSISDDMKAFANGSPFDDIDSSIDAVPPIVSDDSSVEEDKDSSVSEEVIPYEGLPTVVSDEDSVSTNLEEKIEEEEKEEKKEEDSSVSENLEKDDSSVLESSKDLEENGSVIAENLKKDDSVLLDDESSQKDKEDREVAADTASQDSDTNGTVFQSLKETLEDENRMDAKSVNLFGEEKKDDIRDELVFGRNLDNPSDRMGNSRDSRDYFYDDFSTRLGDVRSSSYYDNMNIGDVPFSSTRPVETFGSHSYSVPTNNSYESRFDGLRNDRMLYSGTSSNRDNIMSDVASSLSELMKQNREQKGLISQYEDRLNDAEVQRRMYADKYNEQVNRNETLSSKLRSLDEASSKLQSRNEMLERRIHDQEAIIAAQDKELRMLRPQVEGKQDLVKLLADAKVLLGNEEAYSYDNGDNYYRRVA